MRYLVMAVPSRAHIVEYLQLHIPNLEVIWDTDQTARTTWTRALRTLGDDAGIIFEDDILLTVNAIQKAQTVIAEHSDVLIQFHSRRKEDVTIGSRWRRGDDFLNNQMVYYPAGMANKIAEYSMINFPWADDPTGTDLCTAWYLRDSKLKYWNSCPSLAEHLPIVSAINAKRSRFRKSKTFRDPELNGLPEQLKRIEL